jgi:hypothetical protein
VLRNARSVVAGVKRSSGLREEGSNLASSGSLRHGLGLLNLRKLLGRSKWNVKSPATKGLTSRLPSMDSVRRVGGP